MFVQLPKPTEPKPFIIQKGVPVPASVRHQRRWIQLPFDQMEIGDSFVVDDIYTKGDEMSLRGRATRENKRGDGKFFSAVKNRDLANSIRIFRIQ